MHTGVVQIMVLHWRCCLRFKNSNSSHFTASLTMIIFASLIVFAVYWYSVHSTLVNHNDSWDINTQKGIMRGQNLNVRKIFHPTNKFHTCYEIRCDGSHCPPIDNSTNPVQICYPAIIITGLPKCGTSAMYELLSRFPGAVTMHEKENCPSTRRRAHWIYFNSLPLMKSLKAESIVIDGCVDIIVNLKMRVMLHNPDTYYIVMIRDYADMLWSSYNFWCKREYDKVMCEYDKWTNPAYHVRSPELFHELIVLDANYTKEVIQPFYYPMHLPCINAGGYYSEYIDNHLVRNRLKNYTIVIASEELETYPMVSAKKIAHKLGIDISHLDIKNFTEVRINSQENKGTTHAISIDKYKHGLYNISGYRPMLDATRELLYKCWHDDCIKISQYTGYNYSACFNSKISKSQSTSSSDKVHNDQHAQDQQQQRKSLRVSLPLELSDV